MPKTIYNSTKGLFAESGNGFEFDSSTSGNTPVHVSAPVEAITVAAGNGTETGEATEVITLTTHTGARDLTLTDGLALGQEKIIVVTTSGGGNVVIKDSNGAVATWAAPAQFDTAVLVWNSSSWKLVNSN